MHLIKQLSFSLDWQTQFQLQSEYRQLSEQMTYEICYRIHLLLYIGDLQNFLVHLPFSAHARSDKLVNLIPEKIKNTAKWTHIIKV